MTEASYQLGPISAGADSPLGGLFAGLFGLNQTASGLASNYATGVNAYINDPSGAYKAFFGTATAADAPGLAAAEQKGLSSNPFVSAGQSLGALLGFGIGAAGTTVGVTGTTASPGIAVGAGAAATGVTSAAAAGVTGAASGILPGLSNGIGAGLANAGSGIAAALGGGGPGSGLGGAFSSPFFLIAGGLILILLFFTL
jgi:hypothetical protein